MSEPASQLLATIAKLADVFHTPDGKCYASIPVHRHEETWPVRSKRFKGWLSRSFYLDKHKPPPTQALGEILALTEARALDGPECPVHVRVAAHADALYLDLVDAEWRAVEITRNGWGVVPQAPVRFHRAAGMRELPYPIAGDQLDTLRGFLNVGDDTTWRLLAHWLVMAFHPHGPYPVLALFGEQGAAKSTTARVLRELVDPNEAPLRSEPREPRDLMIAASHGWVIALDNVSSLPTWLSDAICRLSTGGGFSTRELYTDDDEVIFSAKRPVIVNGIDEVVARGDLMQRTLLVELPVIPADQRREESDFWSAFETSRPRLCGALLDAVAAGLREVSRVRLVSLPRMADFAKWSVAVERGLDWEPGFLTAYMQNIDTAHEAVLDGSPVAAAVRTLMDGAGSFWTGTATDLLTRLTGQADETLRRGRAWPKTPRGLSGALRRVAPNLREVGLHVTFDREPGGNRRRTVTIEYRDSSVPTVPPVPDGTDETSRDGRDAKIPPLDVADALPSWATEEDGEL